MNDLTPIRRMALLVSTDSFESFYARVIGLDKDKLINTYRNDGMFYIAKELSRRNIGVLLYIPSYRHEGLYRASDGIVIRFIRINSAWVEHVVRFGMRCFRTGRYISEAVNANLMKEALISGLKDDTIDVLYLQEFWTARFDAISRWREITTPIIAADHGGRSDRTLLFRKSSALKRASSIIVQTRQQQQELSRLGIQSTYLPNAVDTNAIRPDPEVPRQANSILTVARLTNRQKRTTDLIKALALLPDSWSLKIAGTGPDRSLLEDIAKRYGVSGRVIFLGFLNRDDLRHELLQCAVFALPSRHEAMALAALEAMSAGCAVVLSSIPPFRDLIQAEENGILVPVGNVELLAAAIKRAAAAAVDLGPRARQSVLSMFDAKNHFDYLATIVRNAAHNARNKLTVSEQLL